MQKPLPLIRFLVTVIVTLAAGCLSTSHVISRGDLATLARQDPQARGQSVRVVQSFASSDEPPPAEPATMGGGVHGHVGVVVPVEPVGPAPAPAPLHQMSAKGASDRGAFWVAVAAAVAVGLAVTEGARYDGWVELDPMHPVHLYSWDGSYTWMPLANITPEVAQRTRRAVVREEEGAWRRLGRAPLNRRGWTYSVLMGSSQTPVAPGEVARGFTSHIQFGAFPSQEVGVLFDLSLGWIRDSFGDMTYDSRSAVELQILPVAAGKLHGGVFGQIGAGYRLDDRDIGYDRQGILYGGGAMAQLELTTRLAITGRAGMTRAYGIRSTDLTVGLSIY